MGVIRCGSCPVWESSGIGNMTPIPDNWPVRYRGIGVYQTSGVGGLKEAIKVF